VSKTVYFNFQDGNGWQDYSHLVRDDLVIIRRAFSDDFRFANNAVSFTVNYDPTLFAYLLAPTKDVLVRVKDGATYLFTGYIPPTMERVYDGYYKTMQLKIEAIDYTDFLKEAVGDISYEDKKIMDPSDTANSLVHLIFGLIDLDSSYGEFIDRGNCESSVPPMVRDEVSPITDNCTWERSDEQAYEGSYSWKMTVTTGGTRAVADFVDGNNPADLHGLLPGKKYKISCRVYIPSSGGPSNPNEVALRIYEYYSGGWHINQVIASIQDSWELLDLGEITINSNATGVVLRIWIYSTVSSGEYIYVDDVHCQFEEENIDNSKSITTTVEAVTSLSENETALTILSDLLYEHGYAVNWNEEGKFSPLQWNKSAGSSPTHTFDDNNIVEKIKKEDKDNRLYFGVNIKWYEIGEKDNVLLYRADTPYDEDTNLFLGYTILNGYYYPVEANVDDPITGQKQVVYQEYTDRGIKYLTNPVIEGELDFNPEAFESDFSEILITKNHSLDINYDGYPGTDIITVEEYYNKKARILLYNDTGSNIDLYYLNIYGTVVYKTSERESKIRLSSVARRGVNTENLLKYTARFLFTSSKAESLAKGLAKNIEKGNRYYFFSSEDEVAVGDLVTIDTEYEDDTAIIIERIYDEQTEVYSYYAKRYDVSYSSLSELRQRLLHSLPPDPIKMVQIVPPYENIQTAIDILASNSNGGTIYLTAGDYYLTNTLIQKSNVVIKGRGDRTIIHGQTGSDDVIRMEDSNVTGASIEDVKIVNDEAEEYIKYLVNFNGAVSCRLKSCSLDFTKCLGVRLNGDSGGVINNKLLGGKIKDIWQKGAKATFNPVTTSYISITALSSTKIAIVYRDPGNSNYGTAIIGDISGTTITFGSEYVFNSAHTEHISITALSSTKIAIAYRDYGNSSYGTAIIGDVSGTTITFGSEYVFNAGIAQEIYITALSSTKIAIAYQDYSNSNYGTAIIGDVSGTTITFGSEYVFNAAGTTTPAITALSSTKIAIAYRDSGNSYYGTAIIGDVSGTTITFGSEYVFNTGETYSIAIISLSSTKTAICYTDRGNSDYGTAIIGDVSGTVITFGSEYVFNAGATSYVSITVLSSTKIAIAYQDVNSSNYGTIKYGYLIDETTLIFSEKYIFNEASTSHLDITFLEQNNVILAYGSGMAGKAQVVTGGEESVPVLIDGDDNIFHGNQILAIDDYLYTQLVSVLVQGKRNSIVNNVINGLDEQQKKIKYGIITTDTSKDNLIANNSVSNVEKCAIMNSGDRNTIGGNKCVDNGEFIDRWDCEEEVAPMVRDEVSPFTQNCTWERSDEQAYEGSYSWKLMITTGGTRAFADFADNNETTDMHGLLVGKKYKMSCRVYVPSTGGPSASEVTLIFYQYYSGGWKRTEIIPTTQDAWELLDLGEITINPDTTAITIRIDIDSTASSGEFIYVDDIHCQIIGEHNEYEHQFQDYGTNTQLG